MKVQYVHLSKATMSATLTRAEALRLIEAIAKAAAKSERIRLWAQKPGHVSKDGKRWKTPGLSAMANP